MATGSQKILNRAGAIEQNFVLITVNISHLFLIRWHPGRYSS